MFQINFSSNTPIYEQLYTEVIRLAADAFFRAAKDAVKAGVTKGELQILLNDAFTE